MFYAIIFAIFGMKIATVGALVGALATPVTLLLARAAPSVKWPAHWLAGSAFVAINASLVGTGGYHSRGLAWLAIPAVMATLIGGRASGLSWLGASIAGLLGLRALDGHPITQNLLPTELLPLYDFIVPTSFLVCLFTALWSFDLAQKQAAAAAEAAREAETEALESAQLIVDSVEEGLAIARRDGGLEPSRSASLRKWFGTPAPGTKVWALFREASPHFSEWLRLSWPSLSDEWIPRPLRLTQLPTAFEADGKSFEVGYRFASEAADAAVLLAVRDVSAERGLAAAERERQDLGELTRWFNRDRASTLDFLQEARGTVQLLTRGAPDLRLALRSLHTLKANAALFGLGSFAEWVHDQEGRLSATGDLDALARQLEQRWPRLEAAFRPLIELDLAHISVERPRYEALLAAAEADEPAVTLAWRLRLWTWDGVRDRLEHLRLQAKVTATKLGKPETVVVARTADICLPPSPAWRRFWSAVPHALRNALDHGIEPSKMRVAAGKSPFGTVELHAELEKDRLVVEIVDDGRGIDWTRVAERARALGHPARTRAELERALMSDGLSTREAASETSGRGVGTSALLEATEALGGTLRVSSEPGRGTRWTATLPVATAYVATPEPIATARRSSGTAG